MEKVRIRLEGISKSYYAKTAVTQALRKVNLTFQMGEFVAITGESGSGKSTLLNIIGGMDTFDDGEMYVDGQPTFQYDDEDWEEYRRNKIGYVFQDYSLIGHYTVLDNMMSGLLIMGESRESAERISRHYLKLVGLEGYELHKATELSSGQKQRLSIARALAKNTGIIVADEPTGNLDSETGEQIIALLKELSKERLVIMVTHNYEQAAAYVTRKIRIHEGEIVVDVPVNEDKEEKMQSADENHM
ncbi:MAG: ABC transporter ATP-binding protein, partial [Agathobacter sp.]|nr:ABC transporter ATP-binding protein [Agathobacter sp.]